MKCEKCGSELIIGMHTGRSMYDAVQYQLECKACGHDWHQVIRMRGSKEVREARQKEWENVVIVPNSFEKERQEREDKIKSGFCPSCGCSLEYHKLNDPHSVYKTRIICKRDCGFVMRTSEEFINNEPR